MDFVGRQDELAELRRIRAKSQKESRFTVISGRRRVGKTELVEKALNDGNGVYLYFLLTRRAEMDLCQLLQEEASKVLTRPILGRAERFAQLFEALMLYSIDTPLTLVIDEFQEFDRINPAVFGDLQGIWDRLHKKAHLNLVVCGSVDRMMNRIFFDKNEPLYGRNTGKIELMPFTTSLLKDVFRQLNPQGSNRDLLALWAMTGGVARYVEIFVDNDALTRKAMLETVFGISSSYVDEGLVALGEEFGKDCGVYFSILSAIASGRTSYAEIRNVIGVEVGGQLTKLENVYSFVKKIQPYRERSATRNFHYRIDDEFFRFWFRFVLKYQHLLAQKQFAAVRTVVERDFDAFAGFALERYFKMKFLEEGRYTRIGGWWDRKGENEIDLVCENEFTGNLDFFEVKTDAGRFSSVGLETKVSNFFAKNPDLRTGRHVMSCLSLADM